MPTDPDKEKHTEWRKVVVALINRLTPKSLAILVALAFVLTTGIFITAVVTSAVTGSSVKLFGIHIRTHAQEKIDVRLNIHFDPNIVNPRTPQLNVEGWIKEPDGDEINIPVRKIVDYGGIYVEASLPDANSPFFVTIETPTGTWKSDDYSLTNSRLNAYPMPNMEDHGG